MYYHVLIKVKKHQGLAHPVDIYKLDIKSLGEVEKEIITPYLRGDTFELEGRLISKEKISRLKVFKSQYDTEYYAKVQDERNRVRDFLMGTKREEILHYHEYVSEITKEVIKRALIDIPDTTAHQVRS